MATFCTNCSRPLESGVGFCTACGARVETGSGVTAPVQPRVLPGEPVAPGGRRYPALRIISVILKVLAVVSVLGGLISGLRMASAGSELSSVSPGAASMGVLGFFVGVFAGLCSALFLWASAELIHLFMDIEENTRSSLRVP